MKRKEEIKNMLKLSNKEILRMYKTAIYNEEELKLFEGEILKRMNR